MCPRKPNTKDDDRWPHRLIQLRQNLREYRELLGLTQEDIAKSTGMTVAGYGSFERGRTMLTGERRDKAIQIEADLRQDAKRKGLLMPSDDDGCAKPDTVCPVCGAVVFGPLSGYVYCGKCGARIAKECPQGHAVPLTAKYCPICGEDTADTAMACSA
jgi:transcriptional regulator with XRE-family HTH domain